MTHADLDECLVADRVRTTPGESLLPVPITRPGISGARRWPTIPLRTAIATFILAGAGYGGVLSWGAYRSWNRDNPIERLPMTTVAKVDLSTVLTASGRVESSHNTVISCELERLEVRTQGGRSMTSGGASTILSLVEEGTEVKKGDVLCRLDSSEYEELVRTQEIKSEQALAAMKQARLNFEVAEISVREFQEGLLRQTLQSLEGAIILNRSDLERAIDRFRWTEQMLEKGYAAVAQKTNAQQVLDQCRFDLEISQIELNNFRTFGSPKTLMELKSEVEKRRFEVIANTQRVSRNAERLAYYRKMVDFCTIRAPHDGFLIYAIDPHRRGAPPIEPGTTVRQSQQLFFLPDLANMEVQVYLHESVAGRIREGMRARARIEGLANRTIEGHVVSVAPLPTSAGNWISDEVKFFVGVVKLDSVPKGIRPGMSAEVEFDVDRRFDVLAVPPEAVAVERGHNVCYIAGIDGLKRMPVTLGRSNRDLLEVTRGLAEGDQVVLNPGKIDTLDELVENPELEDEYLEHTAADFAPSAASPASVE